MLPRLARVVAHRGAATLPHGFAATLEDPASRKIPVYKMHLGSRLCEHFRAS